MRTIIILFVLISLSPKIYCGSNKTFNRKEIIDELIHCVDDCISKNIKQKNKQKYGLEKIKKLKQFYKDIIFFTIEDKIYDQQYLEKAKKDIRQYIQESIDLIDFDNNRFTKTLDSILNEYKNASKIKSIDKKAEELLINEYINNINFVEDVFIKLLKSHEVVCIIPRSIQEIVLELTENKVLPKGFKNNLLKKYTNLYILDCIKVEKVNLIQEFKSITKNIFKKKQIMYKIFILNKNKRSDKFVEKQMKKLLLDDKNRISLFIINSKVSSIISELVLLRYANKEMLKDLSENFKMETQMNKKLYQNMKNQIIINIQNK